MMSNKTKAELEERVKELEAEVKRLKEFEDQQFGVGERRGMAQ